jgi:ATP-dependent Clp protease ATP-binding subunit ClpC
VTFERFNDPARATIVLAQEEARRLRHPHIRTEHLLLALVRDDAGPAGATFRQLGVTLDGAREQVAADVPPGEVEPTGQIPFSPRAKGTIDGALRQALGLGQDFIGTEHLLLSLLIERDSRTANVMTLLGAPADLVRTTLVSARKPKPAAPAGGLAPWLTEHAQELAKARGAAQPDAGDLTLALADRSPMLGRALKELGVTPQGLRDALARARGG